MTRKGLYLPEYSRGKGLTREQKTHNLSKCTACMRSKKFFTVHSSLINIRYGLAVKSLLNKEKEVRFRVGLPSCFSFWIINNLPLGYQRGYNLENKQTKK